MTLYQLINKLQEIADKNNEFNDYDVQMTLSPDENNFVEAKVDLLHKEITIK